MPSKEGLKYRSWVEIDLDNFRHNLNEIKRMAGRGVEILQVVKADAYGHGAIEISKAALKSGASCLGVANADEGVQLRISGIDAPILILGPSTVSEIDEVIKYNLTPSVSDTDFAAELDKRLEREKAKLPVHIEVDTGMGRGGMIHYEALGMIRKILALKHIKVEGIFSHLSLSENEDDEYNRLQWKLFGRLMEELKRNGIDIPVKHISNGGGVLNFPEFSLNMVRPGIITYGIYPSSSTESKADLAPVMSFKTSIVLLKDFPEGYSIGYGRSYVTKGPCSIATIPVGYGDGYGFILSNQSEALIRGKRAPIVGRISMDMCTVDVTHIPECRTGDEVVLMGKQKDECISANEIAEKSGTISYEVLCALGKRAPRVFMDKGKTNAVEPRLRRMFIPDEERSIERINNIIRSCFQARARDVELGNAVYYEMFETLFGKENSRLELRTGFRYDIDITEFPPEEPVRDYFKVTTRIEYVKTLRNCIFVIGCALNNDQLAGFFNDERCEYRWLLGGGKKDRVGEEDFRVNRVSIDGIDMPAIKAENTHRGYEVWYGGESLESKLNKQARMEIEIVTRKYKKSRSLSAYLAYPTRGLDISFYYKNAGLKNVKEISFFAGKNPYPEVTRKEGESIELKIGSDEWVFPNSGVTFMWDFEKDR